MVATTRTAHADEALATERAAPRGLCVQCAAADDCTFGPRLRGQRVWSCDEFEGGAPRNDMRALAAPTEPPAEERARPRIGLCANCDNWEGCTFPKPESGVWSCDEYV